MCFLVCGKHTFMFCIIHGLLRHKVEGLVWRITGALQRQSVRGEFRHNPPCLKMRRYLVEGFSRISTLMLRVVSPCGPVDTKDRGSMFPRNVGICVQVSAT
jgi:hypothetical protein